MLIAGIIIFLLIGLAISLYLRYRGVRLAYLWLFLVSSVILTWLVLLFSQPDNISPLVLDKWIMIGSTAINLIFQMDNSNWPLSISYFSLVIAFLFTSIGHLKGNKSFYEWVEMIALVVSGWVVLMAGDYWSILIGWTLIDVVELIFHFRHKSLTSEKFYFHFLIKFLGSLVLIFGISRSFQVNPLALFEKKIEGIGLLIPIAAFLHSGLFTNYSEDPDQKRYPSSILIFLRITSFITSFFLLIYVPAPNLVFPTNFAIKVAIFGLAVTQIYGWAAEKDIFPAINKLLIAFGAVLFLMFLSGSGNFIELWLVLLIVPFGWLYLFTDRKKNLHIFLFIIGILISGVPYSLTFQGLYQLSEQRRWMDFLFILIPMVIAFSGFIRHALKKNGNFNAIEPWYQLFYLIGLFLPLLSIIAIIIKTSYPPIDIISNWTIGLVMTLFSFILYFFHFRHEKKIYGTNLIQKTNIRLVSSLKVSVQFILKKAYFLVENFLLFFSSLFENNGGILWSIVFLVLFITILKFQGAT